MFGYVVAQAECLTEDEKSRYRAVYCGLCRRLGERYGQISRFSLTYDMAFLILLLQSLYEPEETSGNSPCMVHPVRKQCHSASEITDYAADMTVALTWHKCRDDWQDDHSLRAKGYAAMLKKHYEAVRDHYSRQCAAIEQCMTETAALEKQSGSGGAVCANFGRLMGELFVWKDDLWSASLRQMGMWLGQFICLMDAAVDYERDMKRHHYNALQSLGETPLEIRDTLMTLIGRATDIFERLPLEQDLPLLRNILYAGVWQQYNQRVEKHEEKDKEQA